MHTKIMLLLSIFVVGEVIVNFTLFKYIKRYFENKSTTENAEKRTTSKPFLYLHISTFKGILERFVLFVGLVLGFSQIFILYGTLKIGSRFDKNNKVLNDYFIIGNFTSILIAISYWYSYYNLKDYFFNWFI